MKAYRINPEKASIDEIDVANLADIVGQVGFDTIESDAIGTEGDRLYFDEECFLRGGGVRFQIDTVIPVSGRAVVVGTNKDGSLCDVAANIENLRSRIKYL